MSRIIYCNHCGRELAVSDRVLSTNCRWCNQRVAVQDQYINHYHAGTNIETAGSIVIAEHGHVRARLQANNLEVQGSGQVYGSVIAREKVTIDAEANLLGDVTAARLEVRPGAHLRGFYRIGSAKK
ncbi:MAG: polymer-forming cytoskeletal protein [Sedimentisphaerales bacterium]|nr:polymer-forming cytoskeletal protein [Sedimentisphaerales bacterium]